MDTLILLLVDLIGSIVISLLAVVASKWWGAIYNFTTFCELWTPITIFCSMHSSQLVEVTALQKSVRVFDTLGKQTVACCGLHTQVLNMMNICANLSCPGALAVGTTPSLWSTRRRDDCSTARTNVESQHSSSAHHSKTDWNYIITWKPMQMDSGIDRLWSQSRHSSSGDHQRNPEARYIQTICSCQIHLYEDRNI